MSERQLPRREFLALAARAAAGAAAASALPPLARRALGAASAVPAGVIVRNDRPEHWETTVASLRTRVTPNERFFVRSHFPVPDVDARDWRLEVGGLARTPLRLSLAELRALPNVTREALLECAGNGRGAMALASTSGTQWQLGAVGNASWTGVKLGDVLARAGVPPEARHVWFECADRAPGPDVPPFLRSIPLEKANDDVLLAWAMNGRPLPALHGAPLRAIVPGWFGMASAKWLTRVRVETAPSDNHFMARGYRYVTTETNPAQAPPVDSLRVKSLIVEPLEGARVFAHAFAVRGFAWAGYSGVRSLDVSADGGATWQPATLDAAAAPGAWVGWRAALRAAPGALTLMARATDGLGESQPLVATPNAGGYGNNSIHRVRVHARA